MAKQYSKLPNAHEVYLSHDHYLASRSLENSNEDSIQNFLMKPLVI